MNLPEFVRDETSRESISRLLPLVTCLVMLLVVAAVSVLRRELVAIPDSWVAFFGVTATMYGAAKGLQLGLGQKGQANE